MRHKGRHERRHDEVSDARACEHVWRDRAITFALPDSCGSMVCDRCGMWHVVGADGLSVDDGATQRRGPLLDAGGVGLESLARRWSRLPGGEWPRKG